MARYFLSSPGDVINHLDRQRHREGADRARIRCFGIKGVPRSFVTTGEIRISIIESTDRGGYPAARDTSLLLSSPPLSSSFLFLSFFLYARSHVAS